ncbi:MAG: transposase [Anaerolineales bacterium]|nr:transposase [Anaerolineales bacterium]
MPGRDAAIYIDEAHLHQDMDLGYTWAQKGEPAWRLSHCPRLQDRIDWYGAYDFTNGKCFIWNEGGCNGDNTIKFLHHLAAWLGAHRADCDHLGWCIGHTAKAVQAEAPRVGLHPRALAGV